MTEKDWGFAFGELGDPLADISWWMTPPYPEWVWEYWDSGKQYQRETNNGE
uniref:Uncharacterized protein n=1 Tax=viral metagenome TaxID=1070528 RepID=A0A6M3L3A3_9ZZZZ